MGHNILVIDDDHMLLALLRQQLELDGHTVTTAESGREGFVRAYEAQPDLILLDVMMPEADGWATYGQLRRISDAPVIILTAAATKENIARARSLGVADILTKPCSFEELRARIDAAIAEGDTEAERRFVVYDDGYLHIDLLHGAVVRSHREVEITPTESRLLTYLARRMGKTVPQRELLVSIWGPEYADELSYLGLYVHHLCQKIERDPQDPRYIRAQGDEGYCFVDLASVVCCA